MDLPENTESSKTISSVFRSRSRLAYGILALLLLVLLWPFLRSYISLTPRAVTVVGIGTKSFTPEKAIVSFSYTYDAVSQADAITGGENRFESILNGLAEYNPSEINKTTYQITQSSSRIPTVADDGTTRLLGGYQYVTAARVAVADPSKIDDIVKYLYTNGAAIVTQVRYMPKDEKTANGEAREMAVKDAKDKARQFAKAAGARVGKVLAIQEGTATGDTGTPVTGSLSDVQNGEEPGQPMQTVKNGKIEIQATVTASFELVPSILSFLPW